MWGPRYRRFYAPTPSSAGGGTIPCDLFLARADSWGWALTQRTGPADFSKALTTWDKNIKFENGRVRQYKRFSEEWLDAPDEQTLFAVLGIPWMAPHERSVAALRHAPQRGEVADPVGIAGNGDAFEESRNA
ncbi:MAG: hypothetical protein H6642_00030 [Caldilineaceae bacterium]|nr:hypothetical protein [Caldilineaceae bacterium]